MSEFKEQLAQELAQVAWSDIIPHAKRDAVIVVEPPLDLITAAEAIALDNTSLVQKWVAENSLHKPSAEQLHLWNAEPSQLLYTLIVQPFVLVCLANHGHY